MLQWSPYRCGFSDSIIDTFPATKQQSLVSLYRCCLFPLHFFSLALNFHGLGQLNYEDLRAGSSLPNQAYWPRCARFIYHVPHDRQICTYSHARLMNEDQCALKKAAKLIFSVRFSAWIQKIVTIMLTKVKIRTQSSVSDVSKVILMMLKCCCCNVRVTLHTGIITPPPRQPAFTDRSREQSWD